MGKNYRWHIIHVFSPILNLCVLLPLCTFPFLSLKHLQKEQWITFDSQWSFNLTLIINLNLFWHIMWGIAMALICLWKEITSLLISLLPAFLQIFRLTPTLSYQEQECFASMYTAKIIYMCRYVQNLTESIHTLESAARRTVPSSLIKGCWIFTSIPGSRRPADLLKTIRHLTVNSGLY